MTTLWRIEVARDGQREAIELRAPSEGQALARVAALRPEAEIVSVERRPGVERWPWAR